MALYLFLYQIFIEVYIFTKSQYTKFEFIWLSKGFKIDNCLLNLQQMTSEFSSLTYNIAQYNKSSALQFFRYQNLQQFWIGMDENLRMDSEL